MCFFSKYIDKVSVLIVVAGATIGSFYIDSILEAIHIATFIASASYFFPIMGGLYWKRATKEGALAGLVVGAVVQIGFIAVDLIKTAPMTPYYLETIHPTHEPWSHRGNVVKWCRIL